MSSDNTTRYADAANDLTTVFPNLRDPVTKASTSRSYATVRIRSAKEMIRHSFGQRKYLATKKGLSLNESNEDKLKRFGSLSRRERKAAVKDTIKGWTFDAATMGLPDYLEKWPFIKEKEGLFSAFRALKRVTDFEYLNKRLGRISMPDPGLHASLKAFSEHFGPESKLLYNVIKLK